MVVCRVNRYLKTKKKRTMKKAKYIVAVMRKVVFLLFVLLGQVCLARSEAAPKSWESLDKETGSSFCPLDSIPDCVKEKTTPKEYELWKKASRYYQVDYSVLQKDLSKEQKRRLYESLAEACEKMEVRGKQDGAGEMLTFALPAPIDSTIVWNTCSYVKIDENLSFRKIEGIVFHSKDYPEAQVKVTVWCVYDKAQNSVQVIKEDMQKAGQAIEVNGSHTVGYDQVNGRLYGSCGGSLVYWDEHKAYQSEDFHKGYNIPLE